MLFIHVTKFIYEFITYLFQNTSVTVYFIPMDSLSPGMQDIPRYLSLPLYFYSRFRIQVTVLSCSHRTACNLRQPGCVSVYAWRRFGLHTPPPLPIPQQTNTQTLVFLHPGMGCCGEWRGKIHPGWQDVQQARWTGSPVIIFQITSWTKSRAKHIKQQIPVWG